jgi:predicted metal-dependent hydrolase
MFSSNTVTNTQIPYGENQIPVKVYCERRANVRMGIARKAAILRIPNGASITEQGKFWHKFVEWTYEHFRKNEKLRNNFFPRIWQDGDLLEFFGRKYTVLISEEQRNSHKANIRQGVIELVLSTGATQLNTQRSIKLLLSRCVAQDCLPEFSRKVHEFNRLYFQKPIKSINFKYNLSNWGSCSTNQNLNFSTRLLFAPEDVIDYVIIHELAHLEEMNHGDKFWKLVSNAMPDYQLKEKWLKENGHLCDF